MTLNVIRQRVLIDAGPSAHGWSSVSDFAICERLYYLKRVAPKLRMGTTPEAAEVGAPSFRAEPLVRGSIGHVGLAHEYARRAAVKAGLDPEVYYPRDEAMQLCAATFGKVGAEMLPIASGAVDAYFEHYDAREDLPVVAIEAPVSAILADGKQITQRLDLVIRDLDGRYFIYDHKFCIPAGQTIETIEGPKDVALIVGKIMVPSWQEGKGFVWAPAQVSPASVQSVYEVVSSGLRCHASAEHPFLTLRGYVPASQLKKDDWIACAGELPDREEAKISDAQLTVIGAWICDGSYTEIICRWSKGDRSTAECVSAALSICGVEHTMSLGDNGLFNIHGNAAVKQLLESVGYHCGMYAKDKILPASCAALSAKQAVHLLSILWTGDGAAYVGTTGTVRIVYGSRSRGLCSDIKRLLSQVGILSTISISSVEYKGLRVPYHYVVVVGRESKERFIQKIMVASPRHRQNCQPLLSAVARRSVTGRARNPILEAGLHWSQIDNAPLVVGSARTYDVQVDSNEHNFVVGGFVTHNTHDTGQKTVDRYTLSGQFLLMIHFGRSIYGAQFGGVRANLIGVHDHRFKRVSPEPAPRALADFPAMVVELRRRITALEGAPGSAYLPAFSEQICCTAYGRCSMFDVCQWEGV